MPDPEAGIYHQLPRDNGLDYHAARILLLISAFSHSKRNGIDGLTKLAKLDFLLRYPAMLERLSLAEASKGPPAHLRATDNERLAVESRMIRYKYGPWDDRYYPILGILIGTGLIKSSGGKGRLRMSATGDGKRVASQLISLPTWQLTAGRCEFIAANFNTTGSRLKDLIYKNLPDVVDRPHRTYI
ncbi:hypothetical protein ACN27J_08835 [Solwaraspora sp. WMMB762]|uniref:hypothetical protein n=1 Tax=Solwaraspora sp. WMMB762 TaxID=3404120 RepID=UPI003B95BE6D